MVRNDLKQAIHDEKSSCCTSSPLFILGLGTPASFKGKSRSKPGSQSNTGKESHQLTNGNLKSNKVPAVHKPTENKSNRRGGSATIKKKKTGEHRSQKSVKIGG